MIDSAISERFLFKNYWYLLSTKIVSFAQPFSVHSIALFRVGMILGVEMFFAVDPSTDGVISIPCGHTRRRELMNE